MRKIDFIKKHIFISPMNFQLPEFAFKIFFLGPQKNYLLNYIFKI